VLLAIAAPAPPPDDAGGGPLIFSDTFDRDADTFVPPWAQVLEQAPDRITTDSSVARKGTHSVKFTVAGTDNPRGFGVRADLIGPSAGPAALCEGDELYIGWSILFPSDFTSQLSQNGWIAVAEDGYGSPYGYPPLDFAFAGGPSGGRFVLDSRTGGLNNPQVIWSTPATFGSWMDVVAHYKFSRDPSVGYVELWINGQKQTFRDGSQTYHQNTLLPGSIECGRIQHQNYRDPNMGGTVTLYQDEIKVGTSYAAVAP
jgi:hypothetical protein